MSFIKSVGKGISNAWTGGSKLGLRDALGTAAATGVAGPIGGGVYAANRLKTKGILGGGGSGNSEYGPSGAPAYERPPSYTTEAGTTAQAARMNDNSGAWQALAEQKQRQEESMQMDKQGRLANSGLASARSGLAMRGGLRGGAGERMAANATEANIMGNQMTLGQGSADRLGIGMKAQDMGMDIAKTNASFDQQTRLANAGNAMNRETARNANSFNTYTELMKQKGADYAARMGAKAASKPTLLSDPLGYVRSQF